MPGFDEINDAERQAGRDLAVACLTATTTPDIAAELVTRALNWADDDETVTRNALLWACLTLAGAWNLIRTRPCDPEDFLYDLVRRPL